MALKVIAGVWKGQVLEEPPHKGKIRPTKAMVRASVFNMLESRISFEKQVVADFFAGTGALGIEAASRGAGEVFFVDEDVHLVKQNIAKIKTENARLLPVKSHFKAAKLPKKAQIILADPPYGENYATLLLKRADEISEPNSWWVLEVETTLDLIPVLADLPFRVVKHKTFGASAVWLLHYG